MTISFDPVLAQLGPLQLGWHAIFTVLAVVTAVWYGARRAKREGASEEQIGLLVTWGIVGGLIGARLFHVLDHLPYYLAHPLEMAAVWQGGIAVYGAFIGGLIGGIAVAWKQKLPVWWMLDASAPAMLVGQAIGRLGCFSNGDAWGAPCAQRWAFCLTYTHPNDLLPANLLGVPTFPYPLFEMVGEAALIGLLLLAYQRLRTVPGSTFLVGAVGYALIRFGLTYFRQETLIALGLQEAQVVALITGAAAAALLLYRALRSTAPALAAPITDGGIVF